MKTFPITDYNRFPENFYFHKVANEIIQIGNLKKTDQTILDFGCGNKIFSKKLPKKKILNYDINPDISEIDNFQNYKFEIIILNHVLMHMNKIQIEELFSNLKKINPKLIFLIGVGKQNFLSKIGKFILQRHDAHDMTSISYHDQLKIMCNNLQIKNKKNVFFLTDIFCCSFKVND